MYLKNKIFLIVSIIFLLIFSNYFNSIILNNNYTYKSVDLKINFDDYLYNYTNNNNYSNKDFQKNIYLNTRNNYSNFNHCGNNICQHNIGENILNCPIDCFYN
jgi:ABC-type transport system involved in multi-copper enzyme maturation permease subunit